MINKSVLLNQSNTWKDLSSSVEEFETWKQRTQSGCADEKTELACYLQDQLLAESKSISDIKFNNPAMGLINYMSETNNRMRELMLAYLSIVVAGDDSSAKKLIAGQRLQIGLNPEYVASTCCYGKQESAQC